jgi:ABC-type multidrug transport system fused ATPase/permease subunit
MFSVESDVPGGIIKRSLKILTSTEKKRVVRIAFFQVCMGFLDLFGVMAVGLLGAISVGSNGSEQANVQIQRVLTFLKMNTLHLETQMLVLGAASLILLVGRTLLSIFFTRRILRYLSLRSSVLSENLISKGLAQSFLLMQNRSSQDTLYAATRGVEIIYLQVIATLVVLVSDISLLLILAIGLLILDPLTALGSIFVFSIVGYVLYLYMHVRASALGHRNAQLNIKSNEKIIEVFGSYRESVVKNRRYFYLQEISKVRHELATVSANSFFLPHVSKYVIETTIIVGAILIAATQFIVNDSTHAVATLAVFLAAGTRIAPALLRVQQGYVNIQNSVGQSIPTFNLIKDLSEVKCLDETTDHFDLIYRGFEASVSLKGVSLTYPGAGQLALNNLNIDIASGEFIAIVGTSGAGKTSLVDVVLGVIEPDDGEVLISGLPPISAFAKWPGAVSYLPQDVAIVTGTIRENVAFGYPEELATDDLIWSALKVAHLDEFVTQLPHGIDTQVGERGTGLSGGQRQRLGLARAMFTKPKLLVLDEATSSLDEETESNVSDEINTLKGQTTILMIAHRLSTIAVADKVIHLSNGMIESP